MAKKATATETAEPAAEASDHTHPYCADGCGNRVGSAKSTFLQGHDQRLISDLSTRVVEGEMGAFQRALLGLTANVTTTDDDEFYYVETGDIMDRINAISAAVAHRFSAPLSAKFASAAMAKWDRYDRRAASASARAESKAAKAAAKAGIESPQTKAVFRRLQKANEDGAPIGSTFDLDTRDAFWADAVAHLGDKSDLKSSTLKAADWDRIYTHFASGLVTAEAAPVAITGAEKKTVGQPIENLRGTTVKVKIGRWTYDATVVGMNQAGKVSAVEYTDKRGNEKTTDRFELVG